MARHAATRHTTVSRNIAHADTPGYRATDLRPFSELYQSNTGQLRTSRAGHIGSAQTSRPVERPGEESPNGNTVSLEVEMLQAADIKSAHKRALTIYSTGMDILRSSLGRI